MYWRYELWKESKLLILAIFAKAQKTAAAASARLHASLPAKQAAVLLISSARMQAKTNSY